MSTQPFEPLHTLQVLIEALSEKTPIVHCITNYVTASACANLLLAVGASPIMADASEEVDEVTAQSHSLMLNMGTLNPQRANAMQRAASVAVRQNIPIVFDPVGCGSTAFRRQFLKDFLSKSTPTVIRGNYAEIATIAEAGCFQRGIDGAMPAFAETDAVDLAMQVAKRYHTLVVLSGAVDIVSDGSTTLAVHNGCSEMSKITGMGCMLSAFLAAIAAQPSGDTVRSMAVATAIFGYAGECALRSHHGLGTFYQHFWDAISTLSYNAFKGGLHIENK
jgi:hydroxyethylthiazole kinase